MADKTKQSVNLIRVAKEENLLEKKMVQLWRAQMEKRLLAHLLDPTASRDGTLALEPTDRDYQVAETIVQWFGSPTGQAFLKEAAK